MAGEVFMHDYQFFPSKRVKGAKFPPFRHHCNHDLESVWWVALWSICAFSRNKIASPEERNIFLKMFPPPSSMLTRVVKFLAGVPLEQDLYGDDALSADPGSKIRAILLEWRDTLAAAYSKFLENHESNPDAFSSAHSDALKYIEDILNSLGDDGRVPLYLVNFSRPVANKKLKTS